MQQYTFINSFSKSLTATFRRAVMGVEAEILCLVAVLKDEQRINSVSLKGGEKTMKEALLHIWQRMREPLVQVALVYNTQLL